MAVLFRNQKLIENGDYISLRIVEEKADFAITAINNDILLVEEKKFVKNTDREYIVQLIYNFLNQFTIKKIEWRFGSSGLGVSFSTREGIFLYLENLDFSFQKVLIAIQDKYDAQVESLLCHNPNLQEIYLMTPRENYSSFDVYQNNKIFVMHPMLYNGKLRTTDIKLILQFIDSFFDLPCNSLNVEEHFWKNEEGEQLPLYAWTLEKENLKVYVDSWYYFYIKTRIKEQKSQGIKLCRKLGGINNEQ